MQLIHLADPGATSGSIPSSLVGPLFLLALVAVITALAIVGHGVAASVDQRRSRRQLPPRQGPGGNALEAERRGGTGHDPGPRPAHRPDPRRPAGSPVAAAPAAYSRPGGPGTGWRETAPGAGLTPAKTGTGTGASPVVQAGLCVVSRTRFQRDRARKQAARERAEHVLRKPESTGTQVRTKLAQLGRSTKTAPVGK